MRSWPMRARPSRRGSGRSSNGSRVATSWSRAGLTLADISVGFALYIATVFGIDGMLGPRTKAYYRRLSSRPAFQRAAAVP